MWYKRIVYWRCIRAQQWRGTHVYFIDDVPASVKPEVFGRWRQRWGFWKHAQGLNSNEICPWFIYIHDLSHCTWECIVQHFYSSIWISEVRDQEEGNATVISSPRELEQWRVMYVCHDDLVMGRRAFRSQGACWKVWYSSWSQKRALADLLMHAPESQENQWILIPSANRGNINFNPAEYRFK